MSNVEFTYVSLKTLLFIIFLASGYLLSKTKTIHEYWRIALIPIIAFGIISGLRFGREIDYNVYYDVFSNALEYQTMEPVFVLIVDLFHYLNLSYSFFVFFCSTLLIISFLFFLFRFRISAFYILPLFLGIMGLENLIRWYLSFSFILISLPFLIQKRYLLAIIFTLFSFGIHSGMIICIFIICLFAYYGGHFTIDNRIAIVLFAFSLFLGSIDQLVTLASYVNYLPMFGSDKAVNYMEKATDIAAGSMKSGVYERSFTNNIRLFFCYAIPLYFSRKYLIDILKKTNFIWLYNLAVVSIILMPLFNLIELFNRVASSLMIFSIILVGTIVYIGFQKRKVDRTAFVLLMISFILLIYPILKVPFTITSELDMLFLWDAHGREFLPINK